MCVAGAWLLCPAGLLQHQADSEVFPLPTATSVLGSLCPFLSKMCSQLQPAWRDSLINDSHCSLTGAGAPVDNLPWPETRAFQEKKRPVMSLPPGPGGMWHQKETTVLFINCTRADVCRVGVLCPQEMCAQDHCTFTLSNSKRGQALRF